MKNIIKQFIFRLVVKSSQKKKLIEDRPEILNVPEVSEYIRTKYDLNIAAPNTMLQTSDQNQC